MSLQVSTSRVTDCGVHFINKCEKKFEKFYNSKIKFYLNNLTKAECKGKWE